MTLVVEARQRALTSLESLEPPDELAPEHLALVTVMIDFVEAAAVFLDETQSMEQDGFLEALTASTHIDALAGRVADACNAMRGRARTLGHTIALEC